jgi:uncharacterized protein YprB with RNaseH-like and TPR domain
MTAKVTAFDIEATGLKADFAFLLTCSFGNVGEKKVTLFSLRQYGDGNPLQYEKQLVRDVRKHIMGLDVLLSYYGKGYDIPFLNSKMLEYGFDPLPNLPHVDIYWTAKSNFSLSRKSMQNVAYFSQVSHEKSPVEGRLWKSAMAGNLRALREIEIHNIADIDVLRDVYLKLRPYVRSHPRVNGLLPCRFCGESRLQKRGISVTALKNNKQRVQCQNPSCGAWDNRPLD